MKRQEFDASYSLYSLTDILIEKSSTKTKKFLQTFNCAKNLDLTDFLHNRAITFEKNFRVKTYLYANNETKEAAAYFSIGITVLKTDGIAPETIALLDGQMADRETIPCFLIGQLGKSDKVKHKIGSFLLDDACQIINECQAGIGGRFIVLDSINDNKVIKFYKENQFFEIGDGNGSESIKMIRPYFDISL